MLLVLLLAAQVHAYEKEVKAMLCKPFTFPKYKDLEKILRAPQLRRPTGKKRALAVTFKHNSKRSRAATEKAYTGNEMRRIKSSDLFLGII